MLAHRIAYLLAARDPGQILAITFTNKAAGEMKERVAALVGGRARAMWVSTFHSACVRILRAEAKQLGIPSSFSIYDAADSQRLMTLVGRDLDLDPKRFPPRSLSAQVSNLKNELIDDEDFARRASSYAEKQLAEVYTLYQRRLRESGALDFDDLIMTTVSMLQAFPDVAEHYRRRFRHVLVDEYQDTNHAQYVLIRELVGTREKRTVEGDLVRAGSGVPPAELCVVGDADQSIYAFRGATIRNIVEFERDYPGRDDDPAGAELPLDADHPVGGQRGHRAQRRPQAEEPLVRGRRRRADRGLRRRHRARRGGVRRRGDRPADRRG